LLSYKTLPNQHNRHFSGPTSWHDPEVAVPLVVQPIEPVDVPGLEAYAAEWRRRADGTGTS